MKTNTINNVDRMHAIDGQKHIISIVSFIILKRYKTRVTRGLLCYCVIASCIRFTCILESIISVLANDFSSNWVVGWSYKLSYSPIGVPELYNSSNLKSSVIIGWNGAYLKWPTRLSLCFKLNAL